MKVRNYSEFRCYLPKSVPLSENAEILVYESIQNLRNLLGELPYAPAMDILQLCTNLVDFQTNLDINVYSFFGIACSVAQNHLMLYISICHLQHI